MGLLVSVLALVGCAFHREAPAAVLLVELENLVRSSELILVGEVVAVRKVPYAIPAAELESWPHLPNDLPIADVRVERLLKGPAGTTRVLYVAAGSWTCDITKAIVGETALFFFSGSAPAEERPGELEKAVEQAFGSPDLRRVAWSGRGRMPLRRVEDRSYATYWDEVVMPRALPDIDGPEGRTYIRSAPLDELTRWIAGFVEEQAGPWLRFSIEERDGRPARTWSITGQGQCVLETRAGGSLLSSQGFQLDLGGLLDLGRAFGSQDRKAPFVPRELDSSVCDGCRGILDMRWKDEVFSIPILPSSWEPETEDDALRLWGLLRTWGALYAGDVAGEEPR